MERAALALLVLLAASAASAKETAAVRMLDDGSGEGPAYRFDPTTLSVPAGAALSVQNAGQDVHTFTHDAPADQRLFHTGPVEPGGSASVTAPAQPGEYPFVCVFHGGMRGTLTVTAAGASTTSTTAPTKDAPLAAWLALAALALVAVAWRRA